jgi:hypothetical protein
MKITIEGETEFERFRNLTKRLLSVPHDKIKAKLDAEKAAKAKAKRKRSAD